MFRKKEQPLVFHADQELADRASKLGTDDLWSWADTTLSEIVKYFSAYRRERDPVLMDELNLQTESFLVLVQEIRQRRPGVEPNRARQVRGVT
jgi:hypothetical protein